MLSDSTFIIMNVEYTGACRNLFFFVWYFFCIQSRIFPISHQCHWFFGAALIHLLDTNLYRYFSWTKFPTENWQRIVSDASCVYIVRHRTEWKESKRENLYAFIVRSCRPSSSQLRATHLFLCCVLSLYNMWFVYMRSLH